MRFKKIVVSLAVVGVLVTSSVAMAATGNTPAEILSGLTGKTATELYQQRNEGKTFGAIAEEAGKLDEFKAQMLEERKALLDQRVAEGQLTQEQADEIYRNIQENQADCTGTGSMGQGGRMGMGFGRGQGQGLGQGQRQGLGRMGGQCGRINS